MSWDLDIAPVRETAKAPAKEWRNWWRAPISGALRDGRRVEAGQFVCSEAIHPTYDVARTRAFEDVARAESDGRRTLDYVDAFELGKKPEGAI